MCRWRRARRRPGSWRCSWAWLRSAGTDIVLVGAQATVDQGGGSEPVEHRDDESDHDRHHAEVEQQGGTRLHRSEDGSVPRDDHLVEQRFTPQQRADRHGTDDRPTHRQQRRGVGRPLQPGHGAQHDHGAEQQPGSEASTGLVVSGEQRIGGDEQCNRRGSPDRQLHDRRGARDHGRTASSVGTGDVAAPSAPDPSSSSSLGTLRGPSTNRDPLAVSVRIPTATASSTITSPSVSSARVSVRITLTTLLPPPSETADSASSRTGGSPTGLEAPAASATATVTPMSNDTIRRPPVHSRPACGNQMLSRPRPTTQPTTITVSTRSWVSTRSGAPWATKSPATLKPTPPRTRAAPSRDVTRAAATATATTISARTPCALLSYQYSESVSMSSRKGLAARANATTVVAR